MKFGGFKTLPIVLGKYSYVIDDFIDQNENHLGKSLLRSFYRLNTDDNFVVFPKFTERTKFDGPMECKEGVLEIDRNHKVNAVLGIDSLILEDKMATVEFNLCEARVVDTE